MVHPKVFFVLKYQKPAAATIQGVTNLMH